MSFDIRDVRPSHYVIAAMCGCWKRESTVNPGIWETLIPCAWDQMHTQNPPSGGYGFGQWTNTASTNMRCLNLHNYCVANGYQDGAGDGQLMFLGEEDIWNIVSPRLRIPNLKAFLESTSTSLPDLVWDFLTCWEGVPGDAYQERLDAAEDFLTYIQQHANDSPSLYRECITGNRYLAWSETLHNVMYVYFALNGHLGKPDLTPEQLMILIASSRRRFNNYGKSWIQS